MTLRHQLAVYSPIAASAVAASVAAAGGLTSDVREQLSALLLREYSADGVLLCGSGTQALQLAIGIARCSDGSDSAVALPAFSCFDVASAAVGANAPIALYDIDPDTLGPDLESLDRVLAAGARTCVIAPLYGIPVDWESVERIAARHGARLIEDAAQGHGATWRGRPLGSLAEISTLSFGRGKGWTGGAGGAVLFRGCAPGQLDTLRPPDRRSEAMTTLGLIAQWMLGRPGIYGIPRSMPALGLGETTYHAPREPMSITRVAATALMANRNASVSEAARRRAIGSDLLRRLSHAEYLRTAQPMPEASAGYLRFPVRIVGQIREAVMSERAHSLGLEGSYPRTLGELPVVQARLRGPEREWCGASLLVRELITLPTHSLVTAADHNEIDRVLRAFDPEDQARS